MPGQNDPGTEPGAEEAGPAPPGRVEQLAPDAARELRARAARRDVTERRRVTLRLRQALAEGGLILHYQPQIDLKTGKMRGAEAMLRLHHRRRGLILPHHFMPIAERGEVINDIGAWTLLKACAEAARWPAPCTVAVALAHRQLQNGRLVKNLILALSRAGLPAERLELEMTEAMLIDENEDTIFNLRALHGLGMRLALRNFGTGYASLAALRRLPLRTLKLDRSMVQHLGQNDGNAAIIHAAIEAGHALKCAVLADGVENAEEAAVLLEIGCDEAQGNFYSPPLTADVLLASFGAL